MAFKSKATRRISTDSPESLFADIKTKKIQGLLTQQGDLLREYVEKFTKHSDVAAQLPTGSGKTLVALLIAEWRRLTRNERVVYLCPTKQLVNQVVKQSTESYGIDVVPFTGSKRLYSPGSKLSYSSSQKIAITTYSSLFNSNPFFEDPHLIILDDAHSAEQYVSANWTIELKQYEEGHAVLFNAICGVLKPYLSHIDFSRLFHQAESSWDLTWVDKIPDPIKQIFCTELEGVINENITGSPFVHAWKSLNGKLNACNIYITSQGITIRPYLAPTFTHTSFENATQRLYLSATPGEGGELERVFCRKSIHRLTPPAGAEKHANGRRFFVFPELALDDEAQKTLLKSLANEKRTLFLVGDKKTSDAYQQFLNENTEAAIFNARDIESSKESFIKSDPAIAILANRYDGVDFPGDECRKTVLIDIPTATNLQESFLYSKLSANRIYDSRILTRIIQAFGRCTRSSTDYSLVVIMGERILSYLSKKDRQKYFHPELQGEILFGLEEGSSTTLENTLENIHYFLEQGEEWKDAESNIYDLRDSASQGILPGSEDLASAVVHEVDYMKHLWNANYTGALESCRAVISKLTSSELQGVRALWNYLAGSASLLINQPQGKAIDRHSLKYFRDAAKAAPSLSWLHELAQKLNYDSEISEVTQEEAVQLDNLEELFIKLGTAHNRSFDKAESEIRVKLDSGEHFENGHKSLGTHLGYQSGKTESQGSPDPWWRCGSNQIIVFEDHVGANETSSLNITKARQATTHANWIKSNLESAESATITKVLVTPISVVDNGALCHLTDVFLWKVSDFRSWTEVALQTIRELRSSFSEKGDLPWRSNAIEALRSANMTIERLIKTLPIAANVLEEKP